MPETWAKLVLDASVVIDFFSIGCLNLPFQIASQVYVAQRVFYRELSLDIKQSLISCGCRVEPVSTPEGLDIFRQLGERKKLSEYDRETVALAKEMKAVCATCDGKMRIACDDFGVEKTGTLGILGRCRDIGVIDQETLERLYETYRQQPGFRLSKEVVDEFTEKYGLKKGK